MKRTIVLKVEYLDCSKLKKAEEEDQRQTLFKQAVKTFHQQMGELDKSFKTLRQDWVREEVLIEFPEVAWDKLYQALIAADIVSLIDAFTYDEVIIPQASHLEEIEEKLAKFKK